MALVVTFTGTNFQNIVSWWSETWFRPADFTIETLETPERLSNNTIDFLLSLSVSQEYFVVTSVSLKSERPYQGEPMQFSISFENRGKRAVEQPRVEIYCVDYMYRVWGVWNNSVANEKMTKGCSFDYNFPSPDQKTVGTWFLLVLLYDNAEDVLASYESKQFTVIDTTPRPWWEEVLGIVGSFGVAGVLTYAIRYLRGRREKRKGATKT